MFLAIFKACNPKSRRKKEERERDKREGSSWGSKSSKSSKRSIPRDGILNRPVSAILTPHSSGPPTAEPHKRVFTYKEASDPTADVYPSNIPTNDFTPLPATTFSGFSNSTSISTSGVYTTSSSVSFKTSPSFPTELRVVDSYNKETYDTSFDPRAHPPKKDILIVAKSSSVEDSDVEVASLKTTESERERRRIAKGKGRARSNESFHSNSFPFQDHTNSDNHRHHFEEDDVGDNDDDEEETEETLAMSPFYNEQDDQPFRIATPSSFDHSSWLDHRDSPPPRLSTTTTTSLPQLVNGFCSPTPSVAHAHRPLPSPMPTSTSISISTSTQTSQPPYSQYYHQQPFPPPSINPRQSIYSSNSSNSHSQTNSISSILSPLTFSSTPTDSNSPSSTPFSKSIHSITSNTTYSSSPSPISNQSQSHPRALPSISHSNSIASNASHASHQSHRTRILPNLPNPPPPTNPINSHSIPFTPNLPQHQFTQNVQNINTQMYYPKAVDRMDSIASSLEKHTRPLPVEPGPMRY